MPRQTVRGGAGRGRARGANPRRAAALKARGATPRRPLGGGPRGGGRGRARGMNPARQQARTNRRVTRPIPANVFGGGGAQPTPVPEWARGPAGGGSRVPPSMGGQMRGLGMRQGDIGPGLPGRRRGRGGGRGRARGVNPARRQALINRRMTPIEVPRQRDPLGPYPSQMAEALQRVRDPASWRGRNPYTQGWGEGGAGRNPRPINPPPDIGRLPPPVDPGPTGPIGPSPIPPTLGPRPIGPSPIPFKRPGPPVKGRVYRRGGLVRGR